MTPDKDDNVVAVENLESGARIECRIVTNHDFGFDKLAAQWFVIKGGKEVEIDHAEAFTLGMLAGKL